MVETLRTAQLPMLLIKLSRNKTENKAGEHVLVKIMVQTTGPNHWLVQTIGWSKPFSKPTLCQVAGW
jgi:hypothetical protein